MSVNIDSYTLINNTIKEMKKLITKTVIDKKEHGFRLCVDKKNEIKYGESCTGEKCQIDTAKLECKRDEKSIGIYHTHKEESYPSVSDLHVGYLQGINCIGSYQEIKCFKRKKEEFDALEHATIRLAETHEDFMKFQRSRYYEKKINIKEYLENVREYKKEVDKLIKDYFKVIDVK